MCEASSSVSTKKTDMWRSERKGLTLGSVARLWLHQAHCGAPNAVPHLQSWDYVSLRFRVSMFRDCGQVLDLSSKFVEGCQHQNAPMFKLPNCRMFGTIGLDWNWTRSCCNLQCAFSIFVRDRRDIFSSSLMTLQLVKKSRECEWTVSRHWTRWVSFFRLPSWNYNRVKWLRTVVVSQGLPKSADACSITLSSAWSPVCSSQWRSRGLILSERASCAKSRVLRGASVFCQSSPSRRGSIDGKGMNSWM